METRQDIRNIAIIAHVDHGKTTLVDALLKQSNALKRNVGGDLIMDSNELERERGITIFSKNASVEYHGTKINIIDTPGHADFGGEVERIMRLVDGALLLVDAKEGPMPQTKFVLKKAIEAGHKIIVIINKVDKPDARPEWALDKTFDLFVELGASDEQVDFPVLYAVGAQGKAGLTADIAAMTDIRPVFETVMAQIPPPLVALDKPLQLLTVNLIYDNYKGKMAVGRVQSGEIRQGTDIAHIDRHGVIRRVKVTTLLIFSGLDRVEVPVVRAGDICVVAGIPNVSIGETLADLENPVALPTIDIEEATVKMTFGVNTSPFAGREGKYSTSRNLKERLEREIETDVALRVEASLGEGKWVVSGRGELHLEILIEKMRREGYEMEVSRPQVIMKEVDGRLQEPVEQVFIEVPEAFSGTVIEKLGRRRGEMRDMRMESGTAFLEFRIPTRGLIGYRAELLTDSKGLGIINTLFLGFEDYKGDFAANPHGSLIAFEDGESCGYGLGNAQERGQLFIGSGKPIYAGMIVGQNGKAEDIEVNVCKEKRLSNMRSKGDGEALRLDVPRAMTLESCLEYLGDDELLEVTPQSLRLRKATLDHLARKRANRT